MDEQLENLVRARDVLNGKYSDTHDSNEDSSASLFSALESVLEYLIKKEALVAYKAIGDQIDEAQKKRDISRCSTLMVERDKVLALITG